MVNEVTILYILPLTTKGNSGHQNYFLATVCQDVYTKAKHSTYPDLCRLATVAASVPYLSLSFLKTGDTVSWKGPIKLHKIRLSGHMTKCAGLDGP